MKKYVRLEKNISEMSLAELIEVNEELRKLRIEAKVRYNMAKIAKHKYPSQNEDTPNI